MLPAVSSGGSGVSLPSLAMSFRRWVRYSFTVVVSTAFSAAVHIHSVVFNAVGVPSPFHPPPEVPGLAAFVVSLESAPLDVARVDDSFIDPLVFIGERFPGPRFPS